MKKPLLWLAILSWISVVLLGVALVLMTVQFAQITGGHLPQHAPTHLPAGVLGLDGWANRLYVLFSCMWVGVAAWQVLKLGDTGSTVSKTNQEHERKGAYHG